jgi:glyoxylase-like metal-dependent hydrolase (beta-lactamase superfamily II)
MHIDYLILGGYQTNCYVLRNPSTSLRVKDNFMPSGDEAQAAMRQAQGCLIIDPGLEAEELLEFLDEQKLNPVAVVLTHGHIDHIAGVTLLRDRYPEIKVYIHNLDAEMLTEPINNLSSMTGMTFVTEPEDVSLKEGDIIDQAGVKLLVLHTPGHTPGGISLYSKQDGVVFVGDTLFADSIGRTDFPGGSMSQLLNSVREKLFSLPEETKVYPGHGPATTIAREKKNNPFF